MAITIDNKEYDEKTLDASVKNSIVQVQQSSNAIAKLKAEILNHEILISSHSKNIKDNLPADEEKPAETTDAPTEAADVGSDS